MKKQREYYIKIIGVLLSFFMFLLVIIYNLVPPLQMIFLFGYWKNKKNRLNKQYTFSYNKKQGKYYLHHSPVMILNYTSSSDFYRYREEAVVNFIREHPNAELFAKTMTLQNYYEKNGFVGTETKMTLFILVTTLMAVLANIRNITKFKFWRLIRRVLSEDVMLYKIL